MKTKNVVARATWRGLGALLVAALTVLFLSGCEDLFTFNIFGGGNDPSESIENKIAFELSGASDHNGRYVYVSVTAADDDPTNVIATGNFAISEGAASTYAMSDGQAHSFTAGSAYDVYAFIDTDESGFAAGPSSGDYVFDPGGAGHATVTVDGDTPVPAKYPVEIRDILAHLVKTGRPPRGFNPVLLN